MIRKSVPAAVEVTPGRGLWRPTKAFDENRIKGKSFSKHLPELVKLAEQGYVPSQPLRCRDQEYVHITDLSITFLDDLLCDAVDLPGHAIVKGGKLYRDYLAEVISEYIGADEDGPEASEAPETPKKKKPLRVYDREDGDEGWEDDDDYDDDDDWEDDDEDENFVCVRFPQDDCEWSRTRYTYSNTIGADVGDWVTVMVGRDKKVVLIVADSDGNTLKGENSVRDYECRKATKTLERIASRHDVRRTKRKYDRS